MTQGDGQQSNVIIEKVCATQSSENLPTSTTDFEGV
jgi:hypothetical protein